ncbi:hypothetical protein [Microvirga sp. CF3016]|uniref:hypothetical protein n=1 Tax=Microvirga sp. CF3016 TaxID=3110181 RepID=UPI002E7998B7|nr:hypothetical protein [Microvirga sp. CF3016]MEE1613831.1 hypothetical protein [Microvirga sp. CF3016]
MAYIQWEKPFFVDPATGEIVLAGTEGAVPLPTYGNYGGGGYSAGAFGGEPRTTLSGEPLMQDELTQLGPLQAPRDALDYRFYLHDVASNDVGEPYDQEQAEADVALVEELTVLDARYDPEASLYAGGATFGMIGRLALNDELDTLSLPALLAATQDAVGDIRYGLENLPQQELVSALGLLFEPTGEEGVFAFDFEVTTTSLDEEIVEYLALNALNDAVDFGEADDGPLDTGLPFSGTSDYRLTFNVATRDLDFVSV